jgi:hypothetical protein
VLFQLEKLFATFAIGSVQVSLGSIHPLPKAIAKFFIGTFQPRQPTPDRENHPKFMSAHF